MWGQEDLSTSRVQNREGLLIVKQGCPCWPGDHTVLVETNTSQIGHLWVELLSIFSCSGGSLPKEGAQD